MTRRVLIAVSRGWTDRDLIRSELATVWHPDTILVSGAAGLRRPGVEPRSDALAEECWAAWGGKVERHAADWSQGRGAGFRRNAEMVATMPDECIAWILDASAGATDTADRAQAAGIPTRRIQRFSERGGHRCPGGCGRYVGHRFLACPACWRRLPADLKRPCVGNKMGSDAHGGAVADAFRWYIDHPLTHGDRRTS